MELILALLSLLTAATGALTGARAAEAGFQPAAQVDTIRAAVPRDVSAARIVPPQVTPPAFAPRVAFVPLRTFALTPAVPLYANRRIE